MPGALEYIILFALAAGGLLLYWRGYKRSPKDVLLDLSELSEPHTAGRRDEGGRSNDYRELGLYNAQRIRSYENKKRIVPFVVVAASLALSFLIFGISGGSILFAGLIGFAFSVIGLKVLRSKSIESYRSSLSFFLPLVMERLVMAVQAGQDVLPAISILVEAGKKSGALDPVSDLLARVYALCEAGLGFEESLNRVAAQVDSPPLRHAFVHLGLAYREGGELVVPLRELSDSTQLFYQESIEEDIAKMPVKATMPLLLTFAGLIICFITSPILQIVDVMKNSMPG